MTNDIVWTIFEHCDAYISQNKKKNQKKKLKIKNNNKKYPIGKIQMSITNTIAKNITNIIGFNNWNNSNVTTTNVIDKNTATKQTSNGHFYGYSLFAFRVFGFKIVWCFSFDHLQIITHRTKNQSKWKIFPKRFK